MSDKSDYLELCEKVRVYDSNAAKWLRETAPKMDGFGYDESLSACFVWDKSPQGHFFWAAMNDRLRDNMREQKMSEFFSDQGLYESMTEPEKLPPLSGPVTLEDGTVLVPRDSVNHPVHYAANGPECPHCGSTIECITVTERMGFCLGNTVKYIWRRESKGKALEDLKKARWYLDREIKRMEADCAE